MDTARHHRIPRHWRWWRALPVLALACSVLHAETYSSVEDGLDRSYPDASEHKKIDPTVSSQQATAVLEAAQSRARGKIGGVYVATGPNGLHGVAYLDHVIGRTEFITYLCALDPAGAVKRIEVLVYREPYGDEVRSRSWLERFEGATTEKPPVHKRSVPNINGATLACQAMVDRVRFLLAFNELVVDEQARQLAPEAAADPIRPDHVQRAAVIGGSPIQVEVATSDSVDQQQAQQAARQALDAMQVADGIFNTWRDDSQWSEVVAAGGGVVNAELASGIDLIGDLHHRSGGAFDPTIRPVLELWARAAEQERRPDAQALEHARSIIGFEHIGWDQQRQTIVIPEGMRLDASAILKGLLVDRAAAALSEHGATGLVTYGGSSQRAVGDSYRISVRHPDDPEQIIGDVDLAAGRAMATSGTYHQRWTIEGDTYSHLIDPRTGWPLRTPRAATVIAPEAAVADGLATACCIMDPERALEMVAAMDDCAVWIWDDGREHHSHGWPGWIRDEPAP